MGLLNEHVGERDVSDMQWEENWNRCYDALLTEQNLDVLREGIVLCEDQQEALLRVGASIVEKRQIRIAEHFRYTFLNDLVERDVSIFSQPIMLQRLAQFIVRMKRQTGEWRGKRGLPYLLCVLNPKTSIYILTGVSCGEEEEAEVKYVCLRSENQSISDVVSIDNREDASSMSVRFVQWFSDATSQR